jgi:hypothetical protein
MRLFVHALVAVTLFCGITACNNTPTAPAAPKPITVGSIKIKKSEGKDCNLADSLQMQCAHVDLSWPEVTEGPDALKQAVTAWANSCIVGLLAFEADSATLVKTLPAAAVDTLFKYHREWGSEAPESPLGNWSAESYDTVLLNNGTHLTLQIESYIFTGGAHGMPLNDVASFDVKTGKLLTWDDLVTDQARLKTLLEQKFKQEQAEWFKAEKDGGMGFQFDDVFQFVLPASYGLTDQGLLCVYVPYEVAPYAFGSTAFVVPFSELGDLWKLKK